MAWHSRVSPRPKAVGEGLIVEWDAVVHRWPATASFQMPEGRAVYVEKPMTMAKAESIRLVAMASLIGTTIEWYDFFLYGTAAALVLNRLFFPTLDPLSGTLASLATYSVAFVARPIGGIVIGHYGDRIGRKSMLVLTLLIMGVATFLIGCLPTYQTLGPLAPVLLVVLR